MVCIVSRDEMKFITRDEVNLIKMYFHFFSFASFPSFSSELSLDKTLQKLIF